MFALPGSQTFYSVLIAASKILAVQALHVNTLGLCIRSAHCTVTCVADTSDETVGVLESVLMECTSYQVAGQPMSKADSDRLEDEIAEAVLQVTSHTLLVPTAQSA